MTFPIINEALSGVSLLLEAGSFKVTGCKRKTSIKPIKIKVVKQQSKKGNYLNKVNSK